MNRKEAMEMAVAIVETWSAQPTKSNGYPVDGWKHPGLEEKTRAVVELASFLWEVEDDVFEVKGPDDAEG